jgi:signal transduction histidine kinase/ketosteroid isomerase-like protein
MQKKMKLTENQKTEVQNVYNIWLNAYLNGDVKTYNSYFVDDYRFIGSTNNEEFLSRTDTTKFLAATKDQLAGKVEIRNSKRTFEKFDELVFITDLFDAYFLNGIDWSYYGKFRFSSVLIKHNEGWKFVYQHFSTPDLKAQEGETIGTEQIAAENLQLREAIKRRTIELENKTRELEIEAALEKVRSASLAMQNSGQIREIVKVVFEKLKELKFAIDGGVFVGTIPKNSDHVNYWIGDDHAEYPGSFKIPKYDAPTITDVWDAQKSGVEFVSKTYSFKEKNIWFEYAFNHTDLKTALPEDFKKWILEQEYLTQSFAMQKNSMIGVHFHHAKTLTENEIDILIKFSRVFEQSYVRFLDLQKAEAQAREAEIELALERVRARTMVMNKSSELNEVAAVLFEQIRNLGGKLWGTGFALCNIETGQDEFWFANELGVMPPVTIPNTEDEVHRAMYQAWKENKDYLLSEKGGEELARHYRYLNSLPQIKSFFEPVLEAGHEFPNWQQWHAAYFAKGYLLIITIEKYPEPDILKRFAKVFEQTYTRFLDLQKAEAQAREAQIEAALEKVRSCSLAMQRSDELQKVVNTVFEQINSLGIDMDIASIDLVNESTNDLEMYLATTGNEYSNKVSIPYVDISISRDSFNAKVSGQELLVKKYSFEEKNEWFEYMFKHSGLRHISEERKKAILVAPCYSITIAFTKNSALHLANHSDKIYSEIENKILIRFAKVFEQAYTRFLDLQKAESQAREAKIEAALEKVRSRTMGMQNSNELKEAAALLFQQVQALGVPVFSCGYNIWKKGEKECTAWMSDPSGGGMNPVYHIPLTEDDNFIRFHESKQKSEEFYVLEMRGERMQEHYRYLRKIDTEFDRTFAELEKQGITPPETQIHHLVNFEHGNVMFITLESVSDAHDIFRRFAKVFEQTYTRFLDLQKAEAQAREAQIEAALERVRSRTMAMQHSDELLDVASILFQQVKALGVPQWDCGFNIWNTGDPEFTYYPGSRDGKILPSPIKIPLMEHTVFRRFHESRMNGVDLLIYEKQGEEQRDHYNYMLSIPVVGDLLRDVVEAGYQFPTFQVDHVANFAYGNLIFITYQHFPEMHDVFKRFAKVFEQTYTRFLDLQKAEAQAREAQIEAAMERVRSRTMAMQRSDELQDAAVLLFRQVVALGVPAFGTGFNIWDDDRKFATAWMAGEDRLQPSFKTSSSEDIFLRIYEAAQKGESLFVEEQGGEALKTHYEYMNSIPVFKEIADKMATVGQTFPKFQIMHCAFFSQGYLMFISFEPVPDAYDIFKRFAKVFEQTYTRFLDLQKAEAQAREAQIEASLERVRARAMAMHSSEDLAATIGVFYHEMVSLSTGSIIRCGAGLLTKENQIADLSTVSRTKEGEIAEVRGKLDMSGHSMLQNVYDHWLLMKEYHHVLRGNEIKSYYQYARKQIEIPDYPDDVVQFAYFPMFSEGSFYVFTENELTEEELQVYRRFTSVLSLTYKRYNDLKHAEAQAREAQIEAALERVRSRSLAMKQSHELQEVISTVFVQMQNLGIKADASLINILSDESKDFYLWIGTIGQTYAQKIRIPYIKHPVFDVFYEARDRGETFMTNALSRADKDSFFEYAFKYSDLKLMPDDRKKYVMDSAGFARSFAWSKNSGITIQNYAGIPYSDQENNILKRFAHVFEQAYTRFLDVKNAETQAREAIKQASLDRVRGEIASMRNKEDLNLITPLIWKELNALGISFIRCGVLIMDESREVIQTFLSTPGGQSLTAFEMSFNEKGIGTGASEHWAKNEIYTDFWDKNQFIAFMQNLIQQGKIDNPKSFQGDYDPPEKLYLNFVPFKQGMLYVGNTSPLVSHELNLVQSLAKAFSIAFARYEDFKQLEVAKNEIEKTLSELKSTQSQLIQAEKMASLGELTAGIAHEIQNPLNFVNNFSEVSKELIDEMKEELETGNLQLASGLADDVIQNLEKINYHGKRAADIVKGMLQHSRTSSGQKEPTDINALADEYLRLAYHGLRAKDKSFNADYKLELEESLPKINVIPQDIGRVLLNLINNAFYAVNEKAKQNIEGYKPEVIVRTASLNLPLGEPRGASISVSDNGPGIPSEKKDKIFQPFFTTKPTGQGTGLGLSLSYDIVKTHDGDLKV